MGHLITVQNLLTVLGAARQFDRDDYPNVSPLYPFGFRLEPLSLESLAATFALRARPTGPAPRRTRSRPGRRPTPATWSTGSARSSTS